MNKLIDLHFIQMDKLIGYLNNKLILYPKLICEFTKLDEQQMASYIFPSYVSNEKKRILNSKHGKESRDYKDFYTAITAISILVLCAKINQTIHGLRLKYKRKISFNTYTIDTYFPIDCDLAVILKRTIIDLRDTLNSYNKKFTAEDFEKNFISHAKFGVYDLCRKFYLETESPLKIKAEKAFNNSLGCMLFFILYMISISLFAKIVIGI